jgi:hypothetical protein
VLFLFLFLLLLLLLLLQKDGPARMLASTLTMVDLAGSERVKKSGVKYQALEESKVNIYIQTFLCGVGV